MSMEKHAVSKTLPKNSGISHCEIQPSNNVTSNETTQFVKNVFTLPDIVYTTTCMEDEITIWENGTKKHVRKYHLTMFLQEAYKIYTKLPVSDKVKFSKFCDLPPKNVFY